MTSCKAYSETAYLVDSYGEPLYNHAGTVRRDLLPQELLEARLTAIMETNTPRVQRFNLTCTNGNKYSFITSIVQVERVELVNGETVRKTVTGSFTDTMLPPHPMGMKRSSNVGPVSMAANMSPRGMKPPTPPITPRFVPPTVPFVSKPSPLAMVAKRPTATGKDKSTVSPVTQKQTDRGTVSTSRPIKEFNKEYNKEHNKDGKEDNKNNKDDKEQSKKNFVESSNPLAKTAEIRPDNVNQTIEQKKEVVTEKINENEVDKTSQSKKADDTPPENVMTKQSIEEEKSVRTDKIEQNQADVASQSDKAADEASRVEKSKVTKENAAPMTKKAEDDKESGDVVGAQTNKDAKDAKKESFKKEAEREREQPSGETPIYVATPVKKVVDEEEVERPFAEVPPGAGGAVVTPIAPDTRLKDGDVTRYDKVEDREVSTVEVPPQTPHHVDVNDSLLLEGFRTPTVHPANRRSRSFSPLNSRVRPKSSMRRRSSAEPTKTPSRVTINEDKNTIKEFTPPLKRKAYRRPREVDRLKFPDDNVVFAQENVEVAPEESAGVTTRSSRRLSLGHALLPAADRPVEAAAKKKTSRPVKVVAVEVPDEPKADEGRKTRGRSVAAPKKEADAKAQKKTETKKAADDDDDDSSNTKAKVKKGKESPKRLKCTSGDKCTSRRHQSLIEEAEKGRGKGKRK